MRAKGLIILLFLGLVLPSGVYAQYTQEDEVEQEQNKPGHDKPPIKKPFKDKLFTGGGLGLSFGTITQIHVSPLLGYEISDRLVAGVGGTYIYLHNRIYDASMNIYGGRLFSQFFLSENFILHSEYGMMSFEDLSGRRDGRENIKSFMAGVGYRSQVGSRSFLYILGLYDFGDPFGGNPVGYKPTNPKLRMGITLGL